MRWKQALKAWEPSVGCMVIIYVLSSRPWLGPTPGFIAADKLAHAVIYFGFGHSLMWGFRVTGLPGKYGWPLVVGALYGISDEYHQSFVPGRTMSALDWGADMVGLTCAVGITALLHRLRNTRRN